MSGSSPWKLPVARELAKQQMSCTLLLLLPFLSCPLHVCPAPSSAGHPAPRLSPGLLCPQVKSRVAFGKPLVEQGTLLADIAQSRVEIEQARLLVLKAAHLMDVAGNKAAALDIAMIKMVAPSMASRVIDRAIQAFGAAGLSSDHPLAQFFAWARALRFADGPDEVHRAAVAKMELKHRI